MTPIGPAKALDSAVEAEAKKQTEWGDLPSWGDEKEQEAEELRSACHARIPGKSQRFLPESVRMLFGGSKEASERRDRVFRRAAEVDSYLQSYRFMDCDYCERGWFGTREQPPHGVSVNDVQKEYMNFFLAEPEQWPDPARPMCTDCFKNSRRYTAENDMTFGRTHPALDNLTYFEEQLLSPIQPVVRIFTLHGMGLAERRDHVAH